MTSAPPPRVSRTRTFSLVWIVPLVALAVGGWMIARELRQRGPMIRIEFADGNGIEANRTTLAHKGIVIGVVKDVELKPGYDGVIVHVRLDRSAAAIARAGSEFWVVRPEIGLSGIRGLDLLLTGAQLAVKPGDGPPRTEFRGLDKMPPLRATGEGRAFTLEADRLGSVNPGAPVYFREFKVGEVETSQLADDATAVLIRIRIFNPYADLVRANSVFWNAGGVSLKLSLLGAEVKSTSLESLFSGGIAFATPGGEQLATTAAEGTRFKLHQEMNEEWMKWEAAIPIQPEESSPKPQLDAETVEQALKG